MSAVAACDKLLGLSRAADCLACGVRDAGGVWCGRRGLGPLAASGTGFDVRSVAANWRGRPTGVACGFDDTTCGFGDRCGCIVQSVTGVATDLYVGAEPSA